MPVDIALSIRWTEEQLKDNKYELLQNNPDIWVKKTGKKDYFKVIMRCSKCNSLLDFGEMQLVPGLVLSETPKCCDCGAWCKGVTIKGRESVIIKREI